MTDRGISGNGDDAGPDDLVDQVLHALQSLLDERGMKRADLAKTMGVSGARVSSFFGKSPRNPTVRSIAIAMQALGVEPKFIFTGKATKSKTGEHSGSTELGDPTSQAAAASRVVRLAQSDEDFSRDPEQSRPARTGPEQPAARETRGERGPDHSDAGSEEKAAPPAQEDILHFANTTLRIRSSRAKFIRSSTIPEPAWDLLLYALVASISNKNVTAVDLARSVHLPVTTASRHIDRLVRDGLLAKSSGILNIKVRHIRMTDAGYDAVVSYRKILLADVGSLSEIGAGCRRCMRG